MDKFQAVEGIGREVRDRLSLPLSNSDIHGILAEVRANLEKLDACPLHDFHRLEADNVLSKLQCSKCGGQVNISEAGWYQRGLEHGKAINHAVS